MLLHGFPNPHQQSFYLLDL